MIIKNSIVIFLVLALTMPFTGADDLGPMDDGLHSERVQAAKERWESGLKPEKVPIPKPPAPKPKPPAPKEPRPPKPIPGRPVTDPFLDWKENTGM